MSGEDAFAILSDDAKSVAFALFPSPESYATFHMEEHGPSARSQAGLDELLAAGLVSKTVHNRKTGAATYRPLADFGPLGAWQIRRMLTGELERTSFNLWEPLKQAAAP